jgi:hypothetical protein
MIKHTYKKSTTNDSKTEAAPCFALKTGIQVSKKGLIIARTRTLVVLVVATPQLKVPLVEKRDSCIPRYFLR